MVVASSMQLSYEFGIYSSYGFPNQPKFVVQNSRSHFFRTSVSSNDLVKDTWNLCFLGRPINKRFCVSPKHKVFQCRSVLLPGGNDFRLTQNVPVVLKRIYHNLSANSLVYQLVPAIGVIALAWGLLPLLRLGWNIFLHKNGGNWRKSSTYFFATSYVQPLLLCTGALLVCRALDPMILPSEASQAIKQRLLNFVRSFSTVLAFAYCLSCLVQQTQKFFMEAGDSTDARTMGFQFAGKAIYTAVWVASVSLFMELLGFSTQKWLTAGGLGTVLLTLAGREIFTNFLSSIMIHTTRPFILNDWIQTKIEGYEVSGTVEHVGWWSPTIIRGDDREALYIPNHKFTVSVVRNLTQKSHWRIKTHLAISHLDVNKINNIVADMRKVLAKNPQVEQQRLHRRVFLENINPDNQALLILISCFVKTSHFEEYLCVKEAILLDLLRVISHHRARLATPIRTIRKVYTDADVDNIPFSDSVFTSPTAASNHPFLLIEPSYKIYAENKAKSSSRSVRANEEKDEKIDGTVRSDSKVDPNKTDDQEKIDVSEKGASESSGPIEMESPSSVPKREEESPATPPSTMGRPALDENIVLGVALDGSKRTLPIEDEMPTSPPIPESKELATSRNGIRSPSGSDEKKDDQVSSPIGNVNLGDNREKQSG